MNYQEKIAELLIKNLENTNVEIIAICGAADIGKSFLSKELTQILNTKGVSANHLTLDSFLMSRTERIKNEISGYDIEAYDFEAIEKLLKDFKTGKSIIFSPYDHATGEKTKKLNCISPCKVLVVDGLHSMHERILRFCNFSIFVYTKDEQLLKIRREADIYKRNQSPELSKKLESIEYEKYKNKVEPYKIQADLLLSLQDKWKYLIEIKEKY